MNTNNNQNKKVEEFQIDTTTSRPQQQQIQRREESSSSSSLSSQNESLREQPSETMTIDSNVVNFFTFPERLQSVRFQIEQNFQPEFLALISDEAYFQLLEIVTNHINTKKLVVKQEKEKLEKQNEEHNYISSYNLGQLQELNDPMVYYMNMAREKGESRAITSISKILPQDLKKHASSFFKRYSLYQALILQLLYMRIRLEKKDLLRNEKSFACSLLFLWLGLYDLASVQLKEKHLLNDRLIQKENKSINIGIFVNDIELGKYEKHKDTTIVNRNREYNLSRIDMGFYLQNYRQFSKSVLKYQNILNGALKREICAQCGVMLNLVDLGKRQQFKKLLTINGLCRGEIKFPDYAYYIISHQDSEDIKVYKVCYQCNRQEFNPDDNEIDQPQPKQIKKIQKKQQEAMIRLGHIYSRIQNFEATMYSAMHGDTSFELFNANLGLMVKNLKWRWMQVLSHDQKNSIDGALRYLKQNNHLYRDQGYLCTYELWQEMASNQEFKDLILDKQANVRNRLFRGYNQNTYVLDLPDDEEEGLYLMPRNISDSGYDFLQLKDLKNLAVFEEYQQDQSIQRGILVADAKQKFQDVTSRLDLNVKRNTVYYGDKFLDEKLFPTLFFTGHGGYNSTYLDYGMTYSAFAKMKLLSVRPFYRKNQDYIHMATDRKRKEQLIGFSRGFKAVNQKQHDKKLTKKDVMTHRDPSDKSTYYFAQRGSRKIVGSPQYFIARGEEAQAMVQYAQTEYGIDHPHLFITLTLNPSEESVMLINQRINHDKKVFQDPLAENVAFYLKSRAAVKMILGSEKQQGIFGKVLQHIERIEFQKRGSPHLHMIIWLDKEDAKRLDDGYAVQAVVPEHDDQLKQLVLQYMKHTCNEHHCELSKNNGRCKRGYPKPLAENDYVNPNDVQVYKRLTEQDRWIVPYNPMILKLMKSSCCVEIMTERESITYLTKYVTKAEPSMNVKLIERYQELGKDQKEVLKFLKLGVISIHQSMWQICKFPMFQMSPQVIYLNISTPSQKMRLLKEDKDLQTLEDSDIDIFKDGPYERYLVRPLQIENITFFEFMEKYRYCFKEQDVPKYGKPEIMRSQKKGYENILYYPRKGKVIISATKLFPNDGETFFFRVYLENVHHREFRDFHPANKEKSYYVECIIRNIIQMNNKNDYSSKKFFWEQAKINKQRMQQVLLHIIRDKTLSIESHDNIEQQISHIQTILEDEDIVADTLNQSKELDSQQRQSFLDHMFNQQQTDLYFMKTFDFNSRAEKVLAIYTLNQIDKRKMSDDQQMALEQIYQRCFVEHRQGLFFVTGGAGVGKTHFLKILYSLLFNVLKQKVVMTASTGIAAGNIYGQTIHSLFKLSDADKESNIDPLSRMQKYLQNIDFIIIDEISQLGEKTFEKVQEICQRTEMRKLMREKLFGGKNIILCGDLLQTLFSKTNPLCASDLFIKNFEWIVLQENFRQKGDKEFQELLNRVRIGSQTQTDIEFFERINITKDSKDFEEFITKKDAQVIASTNIIKDEYNEVIRKLKTVGQEENKEYILKARNYKTKKNSKILYETNQKHQEYILQLQRNTNIKLKDAIKVHIGCQIMITRNFDISFQMANGQLCILTEVGPDQEYLKVFNLKTKTIQILGRHTDQIIYKSRSLQRQQFAIQEAYANTIHKVQGLGFDNLIVDCQKLFSFGQAYTAFSRITNLAGLRLINFKAEEIKHSHFYKDIYETRTKMWNETKEIIRSKIAEEPQVTIRIKLKNLVQSFDKDLIKEIETQLNKVNLNIMLESNFKEFGDEAIKNEKRQMPSGEDEEETDEIPRKRSLDDSTDMELTLGSKYKKTDQTMSQESSKIFQQFFNSLKEMKLVSPAKIEVKKAYPFIKWWKNSCYHDSLMHCFYFGIWRFMNTNLDDTEGIEEVVRACKTLDTIPFEKEYPENKDYRCYCERQMQAIQVLRRHYRVGNNTCGNEQIKKLIQSNKMFSSKILKRNRCEFCGHSKGDREVTLPKIRLDYLEQNDLKMTIDKLQSDGAQFPCPDCGLITNTKYRYFITCPKYLLIDVNLAGITPLMLRDLQVTSTNNQVKRYELFGIIGIDREPGSAHYISYLKDGLYNQETQMKGWWRYNGMDKGRNMAFKCETNQELETIMVNDQAHKFIPNLLMYRIGQ